MTLTLHEHANRIRVNVNAEQALQLIADIPPAIGICLSPDEPPEYETCIWCTERYTDRACDPYCSPLCVVHAAMDSF